MNKNKIIYIYTLIFLLISTLMTTNVYADTGINLPRRHINNLNLNVAFLGLGTVELGRDWGIGDDDSLHPSERLSKIVLMTALKRIYRYRYCIIISA